MNDAEATTKTYGDTSALQPEAWSGPRTLQIAENPELRHFSLRSFRNEAEIHAINNALQHTGWNRKRAARLLNISYRSLLYKIRQHNITRTVKQG